MASPAQFAANIANAAFSTGPKTQEGKAASSANALRHGMTSRKIVLPHEDEAAYLALLECTLDFYNPTDALERTLTIRVAETLWRATRSDRYHDAFLAERTKALAAENPETAEDPDHASVLLFINPVEQKRLSLMLRYLNNAKREHHNAVAELEKIQKTRYQQQLERIVIESLTDQELERTATETTGAQQPQTHDVPATDQQHQHLTRQQRRAIDRAETKAARKAAPATAGAATAAAA